MNRNEDIYFDEAIREDVRNPNPFLDELLQTNQLCMRRKMQELMDNTLPHAIVLPEEPSCTPMPPDDIPIAGLLEFLSNENEWFDFTSYEN